MAKLSFKYGAMNSGKSLELISAAYNYTERGHDVVTIKPSKDTKGGQMIVARAGLERSVDILATPEVNVREQIHRFIAEQALKDVQCILADEAQFFAPAQVDQLFEVAKLDDISVIGYGIRTDFQTKLFPGSERFFELSDTVKKIATMCRCENQGEMNTRKINGVYVFDGDQVAIDGVDEVEYDALCGTCYLTEVAKSQAA